MQVIYKYKLDITRIQEIEMPEGFEILSVGVQGEDQICLWAMGEPESETECRFVEIFGTGFPIPVGMGVQRKFIDTVQYDGFVWHVFERIS